MSSLSFSSFLFLSSKKHKMIKVYDRRFESNLSKKTLENFGLDFRGFLQELHQKFPIPQTEAFVLVTTDRTVVDCKKYEELQDGSTLYLLQHKDQPLPAAAEEDIEFVPHYNTLTESGAYKYFAEGQKSLPCSFAELVDNSLWATVKNIGVRTIEIRILFDKTIGKPAVIVLDNGCGMTPKQLNNWAVYRLSKFTRESSTFESENEEYVRPAPVPRSLNSDLSFFGVGGKQAIFHIGDSVRMISKAKGFPDVHELSLSKEDFQKKERNKENVYKTTISNRRPGDSSNIADNERLLHSVISEELGKESFTAVVITGVCPEHIDYLKTHFKTWTRELAHIFHYYIHGVNGNHFASQRLPDPQQIDILVNLWEKPFTLPSKINLREVKDDMQTLYISAAFDTFEFRATTSDGGTMEGVLRYHPFLYDKETYPKDPYADQESDDEEDDENEPGSLNQARGKRDVFECFWNGRLIPNSTVSEFDWCSRPNKRAPVPAECYSRFSGVLFTDDKFKVNSSKQKFMDLELKLKSKETIFTPVTNAEKISKRGNIQKEFTQWLQTCHEKYDKEVNFIEYINKITRTDVATKKMQHPWATFSSIEFGGKTYKAGQLVKSQKTQPILYGSVVKFLLYGNYDENVFATGGQVEIRREPEALYEKTTKIIPISRLDRNASDEEIKKVIQKDIDKLPEKLKLEWPEGNTWTPNAVFPAGTAFGPLKVEIVNRNGDSISSRIHTAGQGIKLNVELKIVQHSVKGDKEVATFVAIFLPGHGGHWFKKNETLTNLGKYTLTLKTVIKESGATAYGGKQLPSYVLKFTIKEGKAENFTVSNVSSTVRVGVPFNIPLQFTDYYNHPTAPPPKLQPLLECSDLELPYESLSCSGSTLTIKGVKARGKVQDYQQSKIYHLKVTLPGLQNNTQNIKFSLLPGNPKSLHVKQESNPVNVENGNPATFTVEVHDEAGNITANPKQLVRCQVTGLPIMEIDCSSTGAGQRTTEPINLKITNGEPQMLRAKFSMPNQKHIKPVVTELKILPSSRVSLMELFCQGKELVVLRNKGKIEWQAGGLLENLFYKLYDESGKEVPLTDEVASGIKVTWRTDVDQADLIQGRLPDVPVPKQVTEKRLFQVFYQDLRVTFCFTVVPCPDEPAQLQVTLPSNTLRFGETLPRDIRLELADKHGNLTKRLTPACEKTVTVDAEGLDKSNLTFNWQENSSSVLVTGLRFLSGSLGPREICFSYSDYTERSIIKLTPGVPSQLKLISGPEQPLQILNGHGIPTPFLVQLCDEWGNPSPDQRVVVELKSSPPTLKVSRDVFSKPVDTEGKASFTVTSVSGLQGCYQLVFKGSFNNKPIPGPSVNLTVIPDPNKPVRLKVDYDSPEGFFAGGTFPAFSVTVVSDEGSPITTLNPADVSMFLWEGVSSTPPRSATKLKCSRLLENDKADCFHFREKLIPERVGMYTIQFSLCIDKTEALFSKQISINVVANQPVKLGPVSQPTPPAVHSTDTSRRILIENMTLKIMDEFGNPAGQDLSGKVVVSIRCPDGERSRSLPLFEEKTSSFQTSLEEGSAHITRLAIMEKSPGENGSRYILVFTPEGPLLPTLAPFELPFDFYNVQHLGTTQKEVILRNEQSRKNVKTAQILPVSDVEKWLKENKAEVERIEKMPRRVCTISNNFSGPDILGMVGHLAHVLDDDAARVLSWHMGGDMDCVITKTTAAAQRIYDETRGLQQVMPLDSILVQQRERPLPHIRDGHILFNPPGNPIYAKDLLIYPHERQSCEKVFKNLLGNTILMDDLKSATNYRKAVVEHGIQCPTILTRQGDRVSAKGKFGGAQNKAPPIDRLQVFGAPLPQHYYTLMEQIASDRPDKRGPENTGEPSGIRTKRARQKP